METHKMRASSYVMLRLVMIERNSCVVGDGSVMVSVAVLAAAAAAARVVVVVVVVMIDNE